VTRVACRASENDMLIKELRNPPEPSPPPVKEPPGDPEDPHAPVRDPDPDPVGPAQV